MTTFSDETLHAELVEIFGDENVRIPGSSAGDTFTGWYPIAVKQRQAGIETTPFLAIVSPATVEEVGILVRWAHENTITVLPVGGGSNTVGSTIPQFPDKTVAVQLSRLDSISWDETALTVTAGAGLTLARLEEVLNGHQYTLGSLPQSARIATVGGAIATEAFGLFAAGYGGIRENTLRLEAVWKDGEIVSTSANGVATRALHHMLIGTEATYGIVTAATLAIRPLPEVQAWCTFSFAKFEDAVDALRLVYRSDARPVCIRLFDPVAAQSRFADTVATGDSILLFAVEGSEIVQTGHYQTIFAICKQIGGIETSIDADTWYADEKYRTDGFAANGRPGSITDIVSVFAPWSTLVAFYREAIPGISADVTTVSVQCGFATPHGAALDIAFLAETNSPTDAIARYERILQNLQEIAIPHGVEMGHHYGIGRARINWAAAEVAATK